MYYVFIKGPVVEVDEADSESEDEEPLTKTTVSKSTSSADVSDPSSSATLGTRTCINMVC